MEEIAVSAYCLVYNHEKYLRQCLDGFVTQKTNFKFEVIVHDDASTDCSADIIREYAEKYPEIIVPIFQNENQHSKHIGIVKTFIMPRMRGKYVAICEGDDYWCDENKLQQQFLAMESHAECSFCTHIVKHIQENGNELSTMNPSIEVDKNQLTTDDFLKLYRETGYPFQTSCYFFRTKDFVEYTQNKPDFAKAADVGDEPLMLYLATKGKTFFINKTMSTYRKNSISSWNNSQKNIENKIGHCDSMMEMWRLFDEYSEKKYTEIVNNNWERYCFTKCEIQVKDKKCARTLLSRRFRARLSARTIRFKLYVLLNAYFPDVMRVLGD